jgi:RNA polymerase sigma-70 factor, ECF subfamily
LEASVVKALGPAARPEEMASYLRGLHLADLALACACSDGHDEAWEFFVREHRSPLYRAADAMLPGGGGRELADSLYGELFGVSVQRGERMSVLRYFHGRASLSTWLRAVLAQRVADRARSTKRLDPLPADDSPHGQAPVVLPADVERPQWVSAVQRALSASMQALPDRDRLRLGLYYNQDLTLAEIGRLLGEHEATVSRHLTRVRRELRDAVEGFLRDRDRMSPETVVECLASVVRDAGPLDLRELIGTSAGRKELRQDRSP